MTWLKTETSGDLRIEVLVAPRASRNRVMAIHDNRLKVQLTAPPVDGKANIALVRFIADALGVARAQVEIISGQASRRKSVRVQAVEAHRARMALSPRRSD